MIKNLCLLAFVAFIAGCASQQKITNNSGADSESPRSVLITGLARPPISPRDVKVYSVAPINSLQIGIVGGRSARLNFAGIVEDMKPDVASIGANGIVVVKQDCFILAQGGAAIRATAIFVP